MADPVRVQTASGQKVLVRPENLDRALADGATLDTSPTNELPYGGVPAAVGAGLLGAASSATMGMFDTAARDISYLAGGRQARADTMREMSELRGLNKPAETVGEIGGLLVNPFGLEAAGEFAAEKVAARVGEGLVGSMAKGAARFGAENAVIGAQHRITEDALGDHEFNGEAVFSDAAKDFTLGAVIGAPFGALGHAGRALGLLSKTPVKGAALDELVGTKGAGEAVAKSAHETEAAINELRAKGMTREEAVKAVGDVTDAAKASAEARVAGQEAGETAVRDAAQAPVGAPVGAPAVPGVPGVPGVEAGAADVSGEIGAFAQRLAKGERLEAPAELQFYQNNAKAIEEELSRIAAAKPAVEAEAAAVGKTVGDRAAALVDAPVDVYAGLHGEEKAGTLRDLWKSQGDLFADAAAKDRATAVKLTDEGTKLFRAQELVDNIQFGQKTTRFGDYVDPSKFAEQLDQRARLNTQLEELVSSLEADKQRGGISLGLNRLRKVADAAKQDLERLARSGGGKEASAELFVSNDTIRKTLDTFVAYERPGAHIVDGKVFRPNVPEASHYIEKVANEFRTASREQQVWGEAAIRHGREQDAFSSGFSRSKDLREAMGSAIDTAQGVRIPEIDVQKAHNILKQLTGDVAFDDKIQVVKSIRAYMDNLEYRMKVALEGGVSPSEATQINAGLGTIREFRATFEEAFKEAAARNKLKNILGSEAEKPGVGGILGAFADVATKPHTTLMRLKDLQKTVNEVKDSVNGLVRSAFEGGAAKGSGAAAGEGAAKATQRPRKEIVSEMEEYRATASNPVALEQAAKRIVGDIGDVAPKIANEARLAAIRAIMYLAAESPPASTTNTGAFGKPTTRYNDTQLNAWEEKRKVAMNPRVALEGLADGHLNRDAIKTAEVVAPRLFAKMQEAAYDEMARLEQAGKLDSVPYNRKAAISTLLKVPADRTWEPQFIASMQAAMTVPPEEPQGGGGGGGGGGSSSGPAKPPTWMVTEAQSIEGGIA